MDFVYFVFVLIVGCGVACSDGVVLFFGVSWLCGCLLCLAGAGFGLLLLRIIVNSVG